VESLGDRYEAEPDEARADALLERLVRARADRARAERELASARVEADAVRAALDGDALHGALRSLTDTLTTGSSAEVAAFNRRLRDHFDGFVIDPEGGPPVPLWKVQVPTHIEQPRMPREPLSGLLARRAEELNLDLSRTPQGSQEQRWTKPKRRALAANQPYAARGPRSSSVPGGAGLARRRHPVRVRGGPATRLPAALLTHW
jgi:hypothetical protein